MLKMQLSMLGDHWVLLTLGQTHIHKEHGQLIFGIEPFVTLTPMRTVTKMTPDDYLIAAWLRGAPGADISRGFPRGFWPDVARTAIELVLAGDLTAPLSFRPTRCVIGSDYEEGRAVLRPRTVKGLDVSKLEFKL